MTKTALKKAEMRLMLKVFSACIKTGIYPKPNSPCHKKIKELLKKP